MAKYVVTLGNISQRILLRSATRVRTVYSDSKAVNEHNIAAPHHLIRAFNVAMPFIRETTKSELSAGFRGPKTQKKAGFPGHEYST